MLPLIPRLLPEAAVLPLYLLPLFKECTHRLKEEPAHDGVHDHNHNKQYKRIEQELHVKPKQSVLQV